MRDDPSIQRGNHSFDRSIINHPTEELCGLSHGKWEGGMTKAARSEILISKDPMYHGSMEGNDFLDWLDAIKSVFELNKCLCVCMS